MAPVMLPRLFTSFFRRRALVQRRADRLLALHGEESWSVARSRARSMTPNSDRSVFAWDVVTRIETQLKINQHPDTATRYHEGFKPGETVPPALQTHVYVPRRAEADAKPEPTRSRT